MTNDVNGAPAPDDLHLPALMGAVFDRLRTTLALAETEGVRASHVRVLEAIGTSGVRLTVMAEALQMTKQGAGQLVGTLTQRELVVQRPDPLDRRARVLVLTEAGHALLERVGARIAAVESAWAEELGDGDYDRLRTLLGRLVEAG